MTTLLLLFAACAPEPVVSDDEPEAIPGPPDYDGDSDDHEPDSGPALALAGGAALFLAGDVWFRHVLRIGSSLPRAAGAALALATIPLGTEVAAIAQVAALALVVACAAAARTARTAPTASAARGS
jgi:hypothetical protein